MKQRTAAGGTEARVPPTMSRMGDVLAGFHAAWEFESDSVLIRFERGIRTPKLFQALGERRIPHEAISAVTLSPANAGPWCCTPCRDRAPIL